MNINNQLKALAALSRGENPLHDHRIGGSVGPRTGLVVVENNFTCFLYSNTECLVYPRSTRSIVNASPPETLAQVEGDDRLKNTASL